MRRSHVRRANAAQPRATRRRLRPARPKPGLGWQTLVWPAFLRSRTRRARGCQALRGASALDGEAGPGAATPTQPVRPSRGLARWMPSARIAEYERGARRRRVQSTGRAHSSGEHERGARRHRVGRKTRARYRREGCAGAGRPGWRHALDVCAAPRAGGEGRDARLKMAMEGA